MISDRGEKIPEGQFSQPHKLVQFLLRSLVFPLIVFHMLFVFLSPPGMKLRTQVLALGRLS